MPKVTNANALPRWLVGGRSVRYDERRAERGTTRAYAPRWTDGSARRRRVDEIVTAALCGEAPRAIRTVSAAPEAGPSTRYMW